jgi:uncharacterized low-complexity protein
MSRSLKTPALLAGSLLAAGSAFASTPLPQGYILSATEVAAKAADAGKAPATTKTGDKAGEMKCGAKAGEMKCGADKARPAPAAPNKAADAKMAEGKCGEGKCGGSI